MKTVLIAFGISVISPFIVYYCVKFGTVAFYRAKKFMNK